MTISRFFLAAALTFATLGVWSSSARAQDSEGIAIGAYYYLGNGLNAPGDMAAVNAWRSQIGRLPAVWSIYQSWTGWNQFPTAQAQRAQQMGGRLMVTWEPWSGAVRDQDWSCRRRGAGRLRSVYSPVCARGSQQRRTDFDPVGARNERRLVSVGHGLRQ